MSNGSSKDKLVLHNPVTLKFWACRNWQFRKMQKIEDEQNFTNYYTLAPLSQSLTQKWVEQENWKWSKHDVEAVKQQTDCTHHARSWSTELAGRNSQLANEMGFFQRVLFKNHLLRAYCLGFDWSGWIVLIKSEILITTGMVWPVSSGKWKRPLVNTLYIRCLGRLLDLKWAAKVSKSDVLEEKTNFPRVFDLLKQRRMRWLGHVVQMNDDRIPEELP